MKFVIVVLVVAVVIWLLLRGRKRDRPAPPAAAQPPALPQAMVACRHCGVHLPRSDALADQRGAFCTEAHRLAGPRDP